jgi:MATE family, multidrug efflux pump
MIPPASKAAGYERLERFAANPPRALWTLSIPMMVGMSIQTLYMVVDMIFVGRVGSSALTALAFNVPLFFIAMGVTFGLGTGITAMIAQAIGAKDKDRADWVAEHAVVLGLIVTAVFTVLGLLYGRPMLAALGVPPELMGQAWGYFRIIAMGYAFMVMSVFFRSILSGEGEVMVPVMIQGVGTVLNIGLDPLFIFTFGLGVRGAALATVASQAVVAAALFVLLFVLRRVHVDMHLGRFRWRSGLVAGILRIGAPASLSFLVMGLGGAAFNRILVEYSGDAVAAHQIGMRLDHVVILPLVSLSSSLVTLVGMFYGARRYDLVRSIVRYTAVRGVIIGASIALVFFVTAPYLVAVFTDSAGIRQLGIRYVRTIAFAYPFIPLSMITGRFLQGLGRGTPELVLSLLRVLLIAVPLACVFTYWLHWQVYYVWVAMVISSVASAAIASVWLRSALKTALAEETAAPAPAIA